MLCQTVKFFIVSNAQPWIWMTDTVTKVDRGMCSWITSVFTLSDDMILRKCGIDAIQYVRFQRHLLVFVFIITLVCITIILPINFILGNIQGNVILGNLEHELIDSFQEENKILVTQQFQIFRAILRRCGCTLSSGFSSCLWESSL